jgi:hypothetical protein
MRNPHAQQLEAFVRHRLRMRQHHASQAAAGAAVPLARTQTFIAEL